jgi:hypothetical protein
MGPPARLRRPGVKPPGFATPMFTVLFVLLLPATSFGVC